MHGSNLINAFLHHRCSEDTSLDDSFDSTLDSDDPDDLGMSDNDDIEDMTPEPHGGAQPAAVQPSDTPTKYLVLLNLPPWADTTVLHQAFGDVPVLTGVSFGGEAGCLFAFESVAQAAAMKAVRDGTDLGGRTLRMCHATTSW